MSTNFDKTNIDGSSLASMIDHTLLKAEATVAQIEVLCNEAIQNKFASVCVNPAYVSTSAAILKGSGVNVCTVIGFPLGANTSAIKAAEAADAVANGADEVDMVINVGMARSGNWDYVQKDIECVVTAVKGKALVKVIIETCFLNDEEKKKACVAAKNAGADFVKTSTGFGKGGATVDDVVLMRAVVGPDMGVKAAGAVRDFATAVAMVEAGANRIGTSSGVAIIKG